MLRFPPTSIGLSESDIDFHLREVQIREHLYAQGFTRQDVQRYYNQRYGHGNGLDDDHVLPTRTPSVTLAKTREDPTQGSEEVCGPSETISYRTTSSSENVKSVQKPPSSASDTHTSSPVSVPSSPPVMRISLPYRHAAVRQSSMLRIMHTAGSPPSTTSKSSGNDNDLPDYDDDDDDDEKGEGELGAGDFLRSPATRMRSYRPRSKTYTYIESEADEPTLSSHSSYEQGRRPPFVEFLDRSDRSERGNTPQTPQQRYPFLNAHSSPSMADPEISSPLTLPPPLSVSRRTSSLHFSLPDRTTSSPPSTGNHPGAHHPSSALTEPTVPIDANVLGMSSIDHLTSPSQPNFLSSPESSSAVARVPGPFPSTPPRADSSPHQRSSSIFGSPESSVRKPPQTEPSHLGHRHNGTFGVYNDCLPAEAQPQTPADLQSPRRRAVPERNVAYTAPPGQIRTVGRLIAGDHDREQAGSQSPTLRAARMRARRAREFGRWRVARMEFLRGSAERSVDDEEGDAGVEAEAGIGFGTDGTTTPEFTRRRFEVQEDEAAQTERRLIREWAQFPGSRGPREMYWRDEFDEDRVGEENFEALDLNGRRRRDGGRRIATDEGEDAPGHVAVVNMARTPEP